MKKDSAADRIYQFNITLVESKPPIWRRIQVRNCTLDKLHEAIQTAMGWTNSHLHHFKVVDKYFGDPGLVHEDSGDIEYEDSTRIKVADILPDNAELFCFEYGYDFGDGWQHEIQFEGIHQREKDVKYPRCLDGERACPPEDVGGIGGYEEFLDAIADRKHERHSELLRWVGRKFDPEALNVVEINKHMQRGLPSWR